MNDPGPQPRTSYWRLYLDDGGVSRFEACALTDYALKGVGAAAPQWNDTGERGEATVVFTVQPVGWVGDWHENPSPQWIVVLSGRWWIESMDGVRIEQGPGEFSFGEDQDCCEADGRRGHRSGTVGNEPCRLMTVATASAAAARAGRRSMTWRKIATFHLVTADLQRLTRFYAALGFSVGARGPIARSEMALLGLAGAGSRQHLTLGPSRLSLDGFDEPGRPYPPEADAASLIFQHLALASGDAADSWAKALGAGAVPISRGGPVTLPASSGGVIAVKFRDPDGHPLEIIEFPGRAPRGTGLFGIDHSAISIGNLAASHRFYAERGLTEGAGSLNRGSTQERLDGLDGVDVEVMPLNPAETPPHLELLGYRRPKGKSFAPAEPADIAASRIVWIAGETALVRDPDGHLHQLAPAVG